LSGDSDRELQDGMDKKPSVQSAPLPDEVFGIRHDFSSAGRLRPTTLRRIVRHDLLPAF
jgi:hypothetical protein